jgi:3-hydroxy acid dehydrogenase/malonic semialdehyde reductase
VSLTLLVTGGSAGFGEAIARRAVRDGHRVIAAARRLDKLAALHNELGPNLLAFPLDVTDLAATSALPESLPGGWREVDVLVNNAGLALGLDPAFRARLDDWEAMVATNVSGTMRMTHALLPGMVARDRGHVVNISSTAAIYPYPGGHVYGASKAFVTQFSLNLRADLVGTGRHGVQPGAVSRRRGAGGDGVCGHDAAQCRRHRGDGDVGHRAAGACQHQPRRDHADLPGLRPPHDQAFELVPRGRGHRRTCPA